MPRFVPEWWPDVVDLLVSLEGIECSGKTSVAALLVEVLREEGAAAVVAHEFVDVPMHARIDKALAKSPFISEGMIEGPRVALPFMILHEVMKIERASRLNDVTLLDRSFDSVAVYQGYFLPGIDESNEVLSLHSTMEAFLSAARLRMPSRTYLLDITAETASERWAAREGAPPAPDLMAKLMQLRHLFRTIAANSDRILSIDATSAISDVAEIIARDIFLHLSTQDG